MILNFGHTIGHAIESATNYKQLLHGQALLMPQQKKLVALTSSDKKRRSGKRAFVLPTAIGATEIVYDFTDAELLSATRSMLAIVASCKPLRAPIN